jgi:small subunit ribosomal protein S2
MAAGAHFGHKKERSHPKSKDFTYTLREGIYIIDLEKTQTALQKALEVTAELARSGKTILFVGTKPQAADLVKTAAEAADMPYIVAHWPGGLLTNFETTQMSLKRMGNMEAKLSDDKNPMTKKERRVMSESLRKAKISLGGVETLRRTPDALFVIDVVAEETAVREAYRLGIPVIGVCDTNANPEQIDYPIPANDDARKTIEMIVTLISGAIAKYRPAKEAIVEKPAAPVAPAAEVAPVVAEAPKAEEKTEAKPARKPRAKKETTEAAA